MKRILRALDHHWFAPASLNELAFVRVVVVGAQLFLFLPDLHYTLFLAAADPATFLALPALKVLMLPFGEWGVRPEPMFLRGVHVAAVISGAAAVIGLYSRPALLTFAAANTLLVAHGFSYGSVHHPQALMLLVLWTLAFSPAGHAFSLDDLRLRLRASARWLRFRPRTTAEYQSPHARWPLRTAQWLFVLVYFSAGLWKLQRGGLDWFNGYTLASYWLNDGLLHDAPLGIWLSQHVWLGTILAVGAVFFELTFAAVIFFPAAAWAYVLTGTAMHTSIFVLQRAPFFQFVALYAVFVEPLRKGIPSGLRGRRRAPWTVLYDGGCGVCIRSMVLVDYADISRRLTYVDLEGEWAVAATRLPGLSQNEALRAMRLVSPDGQVHSGFFALRALSRLLPPLWPLLPALHLPGSATFGTRLYDAFARRRLRQGCGDGLCLHRPRPAEPAENTPDSLAPASPGVVAAGAAPADAAVVTPPREGPG
jgi:predicted DCC family thiol-disulfide oxidoreductase YuxK